MEQPMDCAVQLGEHFRDEWLSTQYTGFLAHKLGLHLLLQIVSRPQLLSRSTSTRLADDQSTVIESMSIFFEPLRGELLHHDGIHHPLVKDWCHFM